MTLEFEIDFVLRDLTRIARENKGKPLTRENLQGIYETMREAEDLLLTYYDKPDGVLEDHQWVRNAR